VVSKKKIIIGIPTLNESCTIESIVNAVDKGLCDYYSNFDCLIMNIDSNSTDDTVEKFSNTKTINQKESVVNRDPINGKGSNILKLIDRALTGNFDYICMFDADIKSLDSSWVKKMISPLIGGFDFAFPIYERNILEGNTTRHLCKPIINYWFSVDVEQPIGGDFSFNHDFAYMIAQKKLIDEVHSYGIDIFLTMNALASFKYTQVLLGRKIHNPSFEKIDLMFPQVAIVLFNYLKSFKTKKTDTLIYEPANDDKICKNIDPTKIASLRVLASEKIKRLTISKIAGYFGQQIICFYEGEKITEEDWTNIVTTFLSKLEDAPMSNSEARFFAEAIEPLFYLRTCAYLQEHQNC